MSVDFDVTWHSGDNSFLHVKAGWTRANGDTVNEYFLETAAPGSFSYDLRGRAPQVSFTSPDPTPPAGMLIDFARLPTVPRDDEEKYSYPDYQHGAEGGQGQAMNVGGMGERRAGEKGGS